MKQPTPFMDEFIPYRNNNVKYFIVNNSEMKEK